MSRREKEIFVKDENIQKAVIKCTNSLFGWKKKKVSQSFEFTLEAKLRDVLTSFNIKHSENQ